MNLENKQRIAIVTGATGGIGKEFIQELLKENLDSIWVIGRSLDRLLALQQQFGPKITPICKDLTNKEEVASLQLLLEQAQGNVTYLINNAGIAQMKLSRDFTVDEIEQTIALNCTAPILLIHYCLPYMQRGSKILNLSSASAFQPVPLINLYASTKAFERSYSRALHVELKSLGITVTAVCPSWVDTKMLTKEINGKPVKFYGIVLPEKVVKKAMKDAKKGKDMSICSFYVRCQHLMVKLLPQRLSMKIWMKQIKKYL